MPAHLVHRLLEHHDRAVHLLLTRRRQRSPGTTAFWIHDPHQLRFHPLRQLKQLLRPRRQLGATQGARLRHALRPQLPHAPCAERVAARQPHRLAWRAQAHQAPVRLDCRLAIPFLLRVDGGREHVGLAGLLVAAVQPVLLGMELRVREARWAASACVRVCAP